VSQEDEPTRADAQRLLIAVALDRVANVGGECERDVGDVGERECVELREGE
jgi:hypothetical protein